MTGIHRLNKAANKYAEQKQDTKRTYSGLLGFFINGAEVVSVPGRTGYVYVRLRDNPSEFLQAYNDAVSLTYDLPVIVSRDNTKNRYIIEGRDIGRYDNWGTSSSYLPPHGDTHSFGDAFIGSDITWVYDRQLMPLLVTPSGSSGAGNVIVRPDVYYWNGIWRYAGNTGTADLLAYKPTDDTAKMVLVYLDGNGNPQLLAGSTFDATLTGTAALVPYLPNLTESLGIPLAGIRLLSGTTSVVWDNIYDFRPLVVGASRYIVQDDGVSLPKQNYLNFIGDLVWVWDDPGNGSTVIAISGTSLSPFKEFTNPSSGSVYRTSSYGVPLNQAVYPLGPHSVDLQAKRSIAEYRAGGYGSTILGGEDNWIRETGSYSIVGGYNNHSAAKESVLLGGQDNNSLNRGGGYLVNGIYSHLILGGYNNDITAGYMNGIINSVDSRISGTNYSLILDGNDSHARGGNFIWGWYVHADHQRAILFSTEESGVYPFTSSAAGEFAVCSDGGIRFVTKRSGATTLYSGTFAVKDYAAISGGDFVASGTVRGRIGQFDTAAMGNRGAGNYTHMEADGTIVLYGNAVGWDTLIFPAHSMTILAGASVDPGFDAFRNTGGSSSSTRTYFFDPVSEEELHFSVSQSPRWKEGSLIYPFIRWVAKTTDAVNFKVAWGLDYTLANELDVFPVTTRIMSNVANGEVTAYKHYVTNLSAITMTGKNMTNEMVCRVFRDGAGTYGYDDDYPADAGLLSVGFHIQVDMPQGSHDMTTK